MNRTRLIILAVALLAALLAAYVAVGLMQPPAPQETPSAPVVEKKSDTVDVLVAARDVSQGERLGAYASTWRPWPRDNVAAAMITREAQPDAAESMNDARARLPLVAGEPIVESKVVHSGDRGFISAVLTPGMRAVAIPISDPSAVGGLLLPNDRVDVILTRSIAVRNDERVTTSDTVLSNVKILAVNQVLKNNPDNTPVPEGRTAVLELTPLQAEILAKIAAAGVLSLSLRSLAEGKDDHSSGDMPVLSERFLNPRRAASGPLIIRYGLERVITNR